MIYIPEYCSYICIFAGGNLVNANISIRNTTITDENGAQISQEWWILEGISDQRFPTQNSSNVVMVFYSERVSQAIFSFVAGIG